MDDISNIVLDTIRVSIPEFIRLVFAGVAGGVIGAYVNDKLTRRREADRDKRLKDEANADKRKAMKDAAHLSSFERDILCQSATAADSLGGTVLFIRDQYIGPWVRAGGHEFVDKNDRAFQARYCDAFWSLMRRGFVVHEGGHAYRLTGGGYDEAKNDIS